MIVSNKILVQIKASLFCFYERISFALARKVNNYILFYPHPNGIVDGYDIINYHSDNVLCLTNYIISHKEYCHYQLNIVVYDTSKIEEYCDYVKNINPNQKFHFVDGNNGIEIIKYASKSKLIFTDTGHTYFCYKSRRQRLICLNYFVPFKNDFIRNNEEREKRVKINKVFDYFLMTAPLPARVSACDKGVSLSNFLILGFCRNDVFYQEPSHKIKTYLSNIINKTVSQFVVFTPTYRDYEVSEGVITRDLFGYDGSEFDELERILNEHNAVIIAKLHPKQKNIKLNNEGKSRIILYSELEKNPFSLYQYLAEADGLITDYTSTYFDFLHRNKPVIFNFYDFELYTKTRGFGFEPIEAFCAGDMVSDSKSFVESVTRVLNGEDFYAEKRNLIAPIFDRFYDGDNTKRICQYFLKTE